MWSVEDSNKLERIALALERLAYGEWKPPVYFIPPQDRTPAYTIYATPNTAGANG